LIVYLAAHGKGILVDGSFTPSTEAGKLSIAPQFNSPSTPITVRFSNSTGLPNIPDTDPNADPRGMAIRFHLGPRIHTDVIGHSTPFFPVRTGAEFLEFFKAVASSPPGGPSPSPVEQFLGSHPSALAFVQAPKPAPSSYGREAYFGVNAFKLIDANGKATTIRYRMVPELSVETLDAEALKGKDVDYLQKDIAARLQEGPVTFHLMAQIAETGDTTDDATIHWPETRPLVKLGSLKLESLVEDQAKEQKYIIFDPIPRVKGVEPSDDPLVEFRASTYLISGRERRSAP
jgi:catalase